MLSWEVRRIYPLLSDLFILLSLSTEALQSLWLRGGGGGGEGGGGGRFEIWYLSLN